MTASSWFMSYGSSARQTIILSLGSPIIKQHNTFDHNSFGAGTDPDSGALQNRLCRLWASAAVMDPLQ